MTSVAYVSERLQYIVEERANELARQTGCIVRQRKFSGADLVQPLLFGWQQHPDASLEQLASTAQVRDVAVTDTAVHKRFTPVCAQFLHAVVEEMTSEVVQAACDVPIRLLRRFSAVILEVSLSSALPDELAELWRVWGQSESYGGGRQTAYALRTQARAVRGAQAD